MQMTRHTDYALRVLIYLQAQSQAQSSASAPAPADIRTIAAAYGISHHHLAKVVAKLAHEGWVQSQRGRGGGLSLAPGAGELTIGQVVRTLETNRDVVECLGPENTCPIAPVCGLKHALAQATEAFLQTLDGYRLADLIRQPKQLRALLSISAPTPAA